MPYCPFIQTLHDETQPVGHLGRGTHYSVLRVPMWQDEWLNPVSRGSILDFAVIWDEDHDERVIEVIEDLYFEGLLAPVRYIGERKGSLTVLLEDKTVDAWKEADFKDYRESVSDVSQRREDPWPVRVDRICGSQHSIIHAAPENVATYLKNIHLLWQIGLKPNSAMIKSAAQTLLNSSPEAMKSAAVPAAHSMRISRFKNH